MQKEIIPNLIQVLWVEDDPVVTLPYPTEAADYDLQLVPYSCWEKAYLELDNNYRRWSAIVLDAKCKIKDTDSDNATRFLMKAIHDIGKLAAKHKREIPWYVLSGELGDEDAADLLDISRSWDADWPKKYYSKNTDREMLFTRIKYQVTQTEYLQVRNTYEDVFKALEQLSVDPECENLMEDLLLYIQDPVSNTDNNALGKLRKVMEYLFISMIHYGIIPNDSNHLTNKGNPNLDYCSKWLAGKPATKKDRNTGEIMIVCSAPESPIVTEIMSYSIQNIVQIAGAEIHGADSTVVRQDTKNTDYYLDSVGNSTYLLRSLTLQICDIILWYRKHISHQS